MSPRTPGSEGKEEDGGQSQARGVSRRGWLAGLIAACAGVYVGLVRRQLWHLEAVLGGYFWLPCPICGEPFSGAEWSRDGGPFIYVEPGEGRGICPRCNAKGWSDRSEYCDTSELLIGQPDTWVNPEHLADCRRPRVQRPLWIRANPRTTPDSDSPTNTAEPRGTP